MAKAAAKKTSPKAQPAAEGIIADPRKDGIPPSLQTQNRKPLTSDQQAKVDDVMKKNAVTDKVVPFGKPKGMSTEEYEAHQSRLRQERETKKAERLAALPKKEKKAKVAPANSFTLRALARDNDIDPRDARRVARANKDKLKVLEVAGKYVYGEKDRAAVLKIIKDGLSEKPAKGKTAPKKKAKIPPPNETVWSGKAKKAKKTPDAPVVSEKAKARAEIKEAMKGRKKIKVEGGAMHIKRRA